jgi:hypothetical protein
VFGHSPCELPVNTAVGGYVPTERAEKGCSYGAMIKSNRIGHVGGQEMVDATIAELKRLWAE